MGSSERGGGQLTRRSCQSDAACCEQIDMRVSGAFVHAQTGRMNADLIMTSLEHLSHLLCLRVHCASVRVGGWLGRSGRMRSAHRMMAGREVAQSCDDRAHVSLRA